MQILSGALPCRMYVVDILLIRAGVGTLQPPMGVLQGLQPPAIVYILTNSLYVIHICLVPFMHSSAIGPKLWDFAHIISIYFGCRE